MRLQRVGAGLGLFGLAVLCVFLLLQLVRKADAAYVARRAAAAAAPPAAEAAWTQTFHFDHPAAPLAVLGDGWSTPELGAGVWSRERRAALRLPPAPLAGPVEVALTVEPFVAAARPFQRIVASAGDHRLGEWRLTSAQGATLRFAVPAELRDGRNLEVRLDLPDAASPKEVQGAMDARLLAIRLRRIDVVG